MKREIIITEDGSHSISLEKTNIVFHSRYGAVQESQHIYIDAGLKQILHAKPCIRIFELGFGTGLNALLAFINADNNGQFIYYETIEAFPLEKHLFENLNYCENLNRSDLKPYFLQLHLCEWNRIIPIGDFFQFKKINTALLEYRFESTFDIIFYDAFAPNAQPELWTKEVFGKLFAGLSQNGLLLTYCSKGIVQRAMRTAGFAVDRLPGPSHKREIIRAEKR